MVVQVYNLTTKETEAKKKITSLATWRAADWVSRQPGQLSETLSKKEKEGARDTAK